MTTLDLEKAWAWVSTLGPLFPVSVSVRCAECGEGGFFCEDEDHPAADAIQAGAEAS